MDTWQLNDDTIVLRRWFHEHPESSFKEYKTSEKIKQELDKLGIPHQTVGETGVVGIIRGTAPDETNGPIIGLRADIDALEIQEQNDISYVSKTDGLMHACGHDGHIASLLTAAKVLEQGKALIPGTVKLIFQPAEEIGCGANAIIKSGLVNDVQAFFGLHVTPSLKTGEVSVVSGPIMAGSNELRIEVTGQSGHGGRPHQAIDAVVAGSAIVQALQQIVSREIDPVEPAVVTIGTFHAGTRANIIANKALITGTVRIITEQSRRVVSEAVQRVVANVAAAYRVQFDVVCKPVTPIAVNDPGLYNIAVASVKALLSDEAIVHLPLEMGTEDFSVFNKIAPVFYAKVGVSGDHQHSSDTKGTIYPLHHEKFNLDENSLAILAGLYVEFTHHFFDGYQRS